MPVIWPVSSSTAKPLPCFRRPRRQRQHRHRAAEQAEQQVHLVCPFPISLNAFQKSTTFLTKWLPQTAFGEQNCKNQIHNYYTAGGISVQDGADFSHSVTALQNRVRTLERKGGGASTMRVAEVGFAACAGRARSGGRGGSTCAGNGAHGGCVQLLKDGK